MRFFSAISSFLQNLRPFLLTLLCGAFLTLLCALWVKQQILLDARNTLDQTASMAALQIETRLAAQTEVLRGLQGAFVANASMGRPLFRDILDSQNILTRLPGFVSISFARLVQNEDLDPFIATTRATSGTVEMAYQQYTVHPQTGQSVLQVIDYLYPLNATTTTYLGLDLLSISGNGAALATSRDEGRGIASPPLRLPGLTGPGFMLHYPVYTAGPRPLVYSERQRRYLGSITAIYQAAHVLSTVESRLMTRLTRARLFDTGGSLNRKDRQPEQLLHEINHQSDNSKNLCSSQIINLPGRQWRLEACSTPWKIVPHRKDGLWLCWLIGISISMLLATLVQSHKRSRDMAVQLADDITSDLRKHENRHRKLEALADEARDLIVIRAANGQIEYANPAAQRRFRQEGKLLEKTSEPLLASAELSELHEPLVIPCSHREASGDIRHYEAMLVPMRDHYGQYLGSALLARDITRRIEQAEELRKTNQRLSDMLELSSDWLWEQDVNARFTHVSGGFFKLHDINPAHMIGRSRWELNHTGVTAETWENHQKTIATHLPYRDFIFTLLGGREPLIVSVSGKPVFDDSGLFVGYRGIGRDITALQQAKLLAQAEKLRVLATLESLSDGVITTDLAGRVDYMNPVAIALTGRELEEALGQPIEMIFQVLEPASRLPLPSLPRQVLANHCAPTHHRTAVLLNRFGLTFTIQEAIACIRNEQNDIMGSVVVFRDLSDWIGQSTQLGLVSEETPTK